MTCMFCFFFFSKHSDKYKQKVHRIYIYQTCTHLKDFFLREEGKKKRKNFSFDQRLESRYQISCLAKLKELAL